MQEIHGRVIKLEIMDYDEYGLVLDWTRIYEKNECKFVLEKSETPVHTW